MTLQAYVTVHCCARCGKFYVVGAKKDSVVCPYCKIEEKVVEDET